MSRDFTAAHIPTHQTSDVVARFQLSLIHLAHWIFFVRMSDLPCKQCSMAAKANWFYPLWHPECIHAINMLTEQAKHEEEEERERQQSIQDWMRSVPPFQTSTEQNLLDVIELMNSSFPKPSMMQENPLVITHGDAQEVQVAVGIRFRQWKEQVAGSEYERFGQFAPVVSSRAKQINTQEFFDDFIKDLAEHFEMNVGQALQDLHSYKSHFVVVLSHIQNSNQIAKLLNLTKIMGSPWKQARFLEGGL
jgi:hypothetical protein